eukprot:6206430-Pleurochrysis_carterae.AAC.1
MPSAHQIRAVASCRRPFASEQFSSRDTHARAKEYSSKAQQAIALDAYFLANNFVSRTFSASVIPAQQLLLSA